MKRAIGTVATAFIVATSLAPSAASAVNPDREIVIFGPETERLTGFTKLDCKKRRKGEKLLATGKSREGWRLEIHVNRFDGFGEQYPVAYGLGETSFILHPTKSKRPYFSNILVPAGGVTLPPFGGAVTFPGGRKTIGLGFVAAFSTNQGLDAVAVAGKAKCSYPKRGKG